MQYLGTLGEEIALNFFKKEGYKLLEQNYTQRPIGEIDLILKKNNTIYFIEVKSTIIKNLSDNIEFNTGPRRKMNFRKIKKFKKIVNFYIKKKQLEKYEINCRLLGALVYLEEKEKIAKVRIIDDFSV